MRIQASCCGNALRIARACLYYRSVAHSINRKIIQSTGIVMASVLISRVLGFLREWEVAHQVGSNGITDAYYAAFTLPDFLNYLVAGGSLSITFIPVFA
ncbi:MAG TPA: lipid II flippase MurJ, partial [Candidatus Acidoferrum sp.]|nr:lipid II flippase MurJ [Candidatus Acidoferrum sp.]